MAVRFTCTINTSASDGETRRSEVTQIAQILQKIAQEVGSNAKVSNAAVTDNNGTAVASYTYTPTAAA